MYWNDDFPDKPRCEVGLIETWDVLKFVPMIIPASGSARLIETWDVLKFDSMYTGNEVSERLIETWDVMKSPPRFPDNQFCVD